MIYLKLNGLHNQKVTLSDESKGEFVWNEPGNTFTCRFQSYDHMGFEVPKLEIRDGSVIPAVDGSVTYKIRLVEEDRYL